MHPTKTQNVIVVIGLVLVVAGFLMFTGILPGLQSTNESLLSGELKVWGVFDAERAMSESLIADFQAKNPRVTVKYRRFDVRTYEQDLINALAAGTGPDVFMIKNTWLAKHSDKITPIPQASYTPADLAEAFPAVVEKDFVTSGQVYALPLYVDSLALFYNKDLFDNAGIANPPKTWAEFEVLIPLLRRLDSSGRIVQAAAAVGGSDRNINEASDLLTLLMLQDGVKMSDSGRAQFSPAGLSSLEYYTSFARAQNQNYTWDPTLHYSLDAFSEESVAMVFNYGHQIAALKEKNPFLNFGVAPMLQQPNAKKDINYANYWGLAMSNKSLAQSIALPFILNSTILPEVSVKYLNATGRPPALRLLIASNSKNPGLGVFARQALTSISWLKTDDTAIDEIISKMIDLVITGQLAPSEALKQAQEKVNELLRR